MNVLDSGGLTKLWEKIKSAFLLKVGGTITGRITRSGGGSWIVDRDQVAVFGNSYGQSSGSSYNPVVGQKTSSGAWTMGNLSGGENLTFNYTSDANYSKGANAGTQVHMRATAGTLALTSEIPTSLPANGGTSAACSGNSATSTTAAKLGRDGNAGVPMIFRWSGQAGQPPWLWGGSDGTNMYVYNPSNFSVAVATHGRDVQNGSTANRIMLSNDNYFRAYNSAGNGLDNTVGLGSGSIRWTRVYAVNATISTSDRRLKYDIEDLNPSYEELFKRLQPKTYKMVDGTSGRTHVGYISQDVEEALSEVGLTAMDFAGFCKDQKYVETIDDEGKETREPVYDDEGNPVYIYELAYEEFIALNTKMIQKLMRENEELKKRLDVIESKLA